MSTIRFNTAQRHRLARLMLAAGLLGTACNLNSAAGVDTDLAALPPADPPAAAAAAVEVPSETNDPVGSDGRGLTQPSSSDAAAEDVASTPETGATPDPNPDPPASGPEPGSGESGDGEPTSEVPTEPGRTVDQVLVAERPTVESPEPSSGPAGRKNLDGVLVGRGELAAELGVPDQPVTLVYEGRGSHVADLLVLIGQVTDGSTLAVDYGDDTIESLGSISTGQPVRVSHAFEPTLTFDHQIVVATVTEPDGTEYRDRLVLDTRARFALYYSPIKVKALSECDTFGKGDFRLTWDHGDGEQQASFALGAGEVARIGGFAGPGGTIVYDQAVPFELELVEEDPWGAWFFAPWKWDGFEFRGGPGSYRFDPIRQVGDHSYTVTSSSSTEEGVEGDDDCATLITFDVTLDMLDD